LRVYSCANRIAVAPEAVRVALFTRAGHAPTASFSSLGQILRHGTPAGLRVAWPVVLQFLRGFAGRFAGEQVADNLPSALPVGIGGRAEAAIAAAVLSKLDYQLIRRTIESGIGR